MKKLFNTMIGENKRFLKYIIIYCLAFPSFMLLLAYIAIWFDKDVSEIMSALKVIFGTELVGGFVKVMYDYKQTKTAKDSNPQKTDKGGGIDG